MNIDKASPRRAHRDVGAPAISLSSCARHRAAGPQGHPATADAAELDRLFPPTLGELSFESGGCKLNALMYVANGLGPHPTVIMLHGYPGNERNLDLAQAVRRAGMNVLFFDYRGSWGSGGEFSILNALEDVAKAVELARSKEWAAAFRADPKRVALVGHSLGGFLGAMVTAADKRIACLAFLAGPDLGWMGLQARGDPRALAGLESIFAHTMDAEGGPIHADAPGVVRQMVSHAEAWSIPSRAADLATRPVLLVAAACDAVAPKADHHDRLIAALRQAGAERVTEVVFDDDHVFSAHRIGLATRLVDWLLAEFWPGVTGIKTPLKTSLYQGPRAGRRLGEAPLPEGDG